MSIRRPPLPEHWQWTIWLGLVMIDISETARRTWLWPAPVTNAVHWWLAAYLDALDGRLVRTHRP